MLMRIDGTDARPLTRKEEALLGGILRRNLIHANPNPDRVGCPGRNTLRDLAFHKRGVDAQTFGKITEHVFGCSPCVQDALVYAEEYSHERKKRRARLAAAGFAAVVVLSVAIWQFGGPHPKPEIAETAPAETLPSPSEPTVADAGNRPAPQPVAPRFEPVTIELPTSWRGATGTDQPLVIPRGRLQLEIRLPIGSPEGRYKLRISDSAGKVRKTLEGTARTNNGLTSIKVAMDTSSLYPGTYTLGLLEPGLDEWSDYPSTIK
jgi:hypothetical protein